MKSSSSLFIALLCSIWLTSSHAFSMRRPPSWLWQNRARLHARNPEDLDENYIDDDNSLHVISNNQQDDDVEKIDTTESEHSTSNAETDFFMPYTSHVEGVTYDSRMAELEAMGGDPFFLSAWESNSSSGDEDDDSNEEENSDAIMIPSSLLLHDTTTTATGFSNVIGGQEDHPPTPRHATDGLGPTPQRGLTNNDVIQVEEWDGTVNEEAHFDFE